MTNAAPRDPFIEAERRKMLEAKTIKDAKRQPAGEEAVTRKEQRRECAKAIASSMYGLKWDELVEKEAWIAHGLKILDSLYGIAVVTAVIDRLPDWRGGDLTNPPETKS